MSNKPAIGSCVFGPFVLPAPWPMRIEWKTPADLESDVLRIRIAELEAEVAARKDWICPETYALTLAAVKSEAVCADAAEAECARLRAFHDAWDGQVAHIYLVGGKAMLDLYNAAHKAAAAAGSE